MFSLRIVGWPHYILALWFFSILSDSARAQTSRNENSDKIVIDAVEGTVEISHDGGKNWTKTVATQELKPMDLVRSGANSRVAIKWSNQSLVRLGERTEQQIRAPDSPGSLPGLQLLRGILSFFHREKPGRINAFTSGAMAGVKGTEFTLKVESVNDIEQTTLSVIDGIVTFSNSFGPPLIVTNLQAAVAAPGQAPRYIAGFIANNRVQWCLYYPGILDLGDLQFTPAEEGTLALSLAAYKDGDLLAALNAYPDARQNASDTEKIYYAGLLLSVGQVDKAEALLLSLGPIRPEERTGRLAGALRQLIAAVRRDPYPSSLKPELPSELLAASYYAQSRATNRNSLELALSFARLATSNSPAFGFGWVHQAELEFSFGRRAKALEALDKAHMQRNAQAWALRGFLSAAANRTKEAVGFFNTAIEIDPGLANAWLGRGLCRIRRGDLNGGREDLLLAASLEPQRSGLRSYLAKAEQENGDFAHAYKELKRAEELDPNDPTAWLYSALLNQQENRINEGVRDLEKSQELNDNRSVYRSRLLLDQDRSVRSANLAAIYRDAGMIDWSVHEASRAVSYDYANYSAHLFLANSFDQLRDPNRINLRFETAAESEYLVANLLAPVQAGSLSSAISQQEYFRLFERDGLGLSSGTEYLSRGAWTQYGAQYGVFGNSSYDLEAFYRTDPGQRPNGDFEEKAFTYQIKQQITPQDTLFFQGSYYDANGGDVSQNYYESDVDRRLRTSEVQNPNLLAGYHHEWSPGLHTLILGGYLTSDVNAQDGLQGTYLVNGPVFLDWLRPARFTQIYESNFELYTAELQQIWQTPSHTTIFGGRYQSGDFNTRNVQTNPPGNLDEFFNRFLPYQANQSIRTDFERWSIYAYHYQQILERLQLIGGIVYDDITYPDNFRAAPLTATERTSSQTSPKAGLIWTPTDHTALRFAFTRSLGGASFDQSIRLEPSTVAGFLQSFRSIIPESVGGAEAGATFQTFGLSLEQRFPTGTYLALTGEILDSSVTRTIGVFRLDQAHVSYFAFPSSTRENLDYTEKSMLLTVDQLIGKHLSIGLRYRLSDATLSDTFQDLIRNGPVDNYLPPQYLPLGPDSGSTLQQLNLYAILNGPYGFFAQIEGIYTSQVNRGLLAYPSSDFWQANVFVGYRLPQRRAELTLGLLNVANQNYQLNPLTLYNDLPRARTLAVRLRFNF